MTVVNLNKQSLLGESSFNQEPYILPLAEQGNAKAQFNVGSIYDIGKGVQQDFVEAIKWYKRSAEQGNAKAQYNLALMYELGKGVSQDFSKAAIWYRRSAEQGIASAQFKIAAQYHFGKGVQLFFVDAMNFYKLSAEQGNAGAQYNLGLVYAKGEEVQQDKLQAYVWLSLAEMNGVTEGEGLRFFLSLSMSPKQRLEAQRMIDEWLVAHSSK